MTNSRRLPSEGQRDAFQLGSMMWLGLGLPTIWGAQHAALMRPVTLVGQNVQNTHLLNWGPTQFLVDRMCWLMPIL